MINALLVEALEAVGDLLADANVAYGIVVVGGASLNLLGLVTRATNDVDVIATVANLQARPLELTEPPQPLPAPLQRAIETVQRDFDLPAGWMNTEIAAQWTQGLPPGLAKDLTWHRYSGLQVGLAGRASLISLKLFAAVDRGPQSVHFQDLLALQPTSAELEEAALWVRTQDAAPEFPLLVDQVIAHVLPGDDTANR